VRDAIPNKAARRVIEGYLEEITGHKYKEWEDYLKWHRRWERVMHIGMKKDKRWSGDLLKYYQSTNKSIPLKQTIAWALERCNVKEAVPLFLEDLAHPDAAMRLTAYESFRSFFLDFPPPFSPTASKTTREAQIEKIKDWYVQQGRGTGS
jgi:hypothetical protein